MTNKQQLDFSAEIAHHEYETIKISITDYQQDGPVMRAEVDNGSRSAIYLTRKEIEELLAIFNLYDKANAILKGGN